MKNSALVFLTWASVVGNLHSQVGSGMGGTTPTTGAGGQTSIQANPTLAGGGGSRSIDTSRSVYISGKVVMQDGSTVPQNVTIQRVCSGITKTVAYTDAKGRFNFHWGDGSMVVADASDAGSGSGKSSNSGGFGSSQSAGGGNPLASDPFGGRMMNCDVRANVAGYSSGAINLFNKAVAENPDIGTIVLQRLAGVEGSSISVISMMAPKHATKAYERGLQSLLNNKPSEALKDFGKAVAIYPKFADAWLNLGKLHIQRQSIEPARAAFLKAIECDTKLIEPYVELGLLAAKELKWKESAGFLGQAVRLDPVDFPQAWYADAVANYNLKNYDAAEKSAREAIKLDPRHANPRSSYLLGLVLAEKRDYDGAITELTAYIRLAPDAPDVVQVKGQLEQIEKLQGVGKVAATTAGK